MITDIRKFNFAFKYLWTKDDFENFQTWLRAQYQGGFEGAFGASVLSGLRCTVTGTDLTVAVSAGIAVNADGRVLYLPNPVTVTVNSPVGNPARTLVVLRPVDSDMTLTPVPTNPTSYFYLHTQLSAQVVVLNGTPGSPPAYPAIQAGDVVLAGFYIDTASSALTVNSFENQKRDVPASRQRRIRKVSSDTTIGHEDNIIEVSCQAGDVTLSLPDRESMKGMEEFLLLRTDTNAAHKLRIVPIGSDVFAYDPTSEYEDSVFFDMPDPLQSAAILAGTAKWLIRR